MHFTIFLTLCKNKTEIMFLKRLTQHRKHVCSKYTCCLGNKEKKPMHLICFKQWSSEMVIDVLQSALNLKGHCKDTHCMKLGILENCKITILQEVNEPILKLAVSKAASLLGAQECTVVDKLLWETDYMGRVFSFMADAVFVSTDKHMCMQRMANQATIPILCMKSRTHGSLQGLATVMALQEKFGCIKNLNIGYVGKPHPVLNSYLLLMPMLGGNIKFMCSCKTHPVTPLLKKASETICEKTNTQIQECTTASESLENVKVVISGPTAKLKNEVGEFKINLKDITSKADQDWVFIHTCPRGEEVEDDLFYHDNALTFKVFENMQYVAASLMAYTIKQYKFSEKMAA